jgi:hypothetical protein
VYIARHPKENPNDGEKIVFRNWACPFALFVANFIYDTMTSTLKFSVDAGG